MFGWDHAGDRRTLPLADHFVDREQYLEISRDLIRDGAVENCEALLRDIDGREFWVNGNLRVVEFQGVGDEKRNQTGRNGA